MDYEIKRGKTFSLTYRVEEQELSYKSITAVTSTLPCRVTSAGHGLTDGWRVAFTGIGGMTDLNAKTIPAKDKDFYEITVVDSNTIELNSVDSTRFKAYTSGGYLVAHPATDLTTAVVRMKVKDKIGGAVLLSTEPADTPLDVILTSIDNAEKTITVAIQATDTAALAWKKGVFDVEFEIAGVVTEIDSGAIKVTQEVTT